MRFWIALVVLWGGAALQQGASERLAILGCAPDFLLAAVAPLALAYGRSGGAVVGFFAGLLHGGLAGANMAQYAASRAIAGFIAAWTGSSIEKLEPVTCLIHAVGLTVLGRVVFMFMAPPAQIGSYLLATIGVAVYNGVIALPIYALLRKTVRKDPL
ncbi:MAG: hypothetical protein AMXMBFR81_05750 [Chthonomonas sp.]|nr:hypothetical protein [Fimbriimonadaceae bacterium]